SSYFLERYAGAREAQADLFFKECLEIADRGKDSENESQARIQRDRLRVDTRKWMAARLAPKKYGDRVSHDVQSNTTLNLQPAVLIKVESSAAPEAESGLPFATRRAIDLLISFLRDTRVRARRRPTCSSKNALRLRIVERTARIKARRVFNAI